MKKTTVLLLFAITTVSLSACGIGSDKYKETKELKKQLEELEDENRKLKSEIEELKDNLDTAKDYDSEQSTENNEPDVLVNFVAETSGVCGADLTWEYGNGILRIHGSGEMSDFSGNQPWEDILDKVNHIYIDEGCTYIGKSAFGGADFGRSSQLSKVVLPNTIKSIGDHAFNSNPNLKAIELPSELEYIGDSAFSNCQNLTIDRISDTVTYIGQGAFSRTNITEITIPDDIKEIGDYSFENVKEETVMLITWRGNTYSSVGGLFYDSELIKKMEEAGVVILDY